MNKDYRIIRQPYITEKATLIKEAGNTIVLQVAIDATKPEIKSAVEKVFGVKVESVNVQRLKGKVKRRGRFSGRRAERKKAYVKLVEGQAAPEFFEST